MMKLVFVKIIIKIVCCLFLIGCEKDTQHPVPFVKVDFTVNLESAYELNTINSSLNYSGGYRGVVIYRLAEDEFKAFDRACTYDTNEQIKVIDPPLAECKECESSYLLIDGSVVDGPAVHQLRQYQTSLDDPFLHVFN